MKPPAVDLVLLAACSACAALAYWHKSAALNRCAPPSLIPRNLAVRLSHTLQEGTGNNLIIQAIDYQCSPCRDAEKRNQEFRQEHPEISWRILQFPLAFHARAKEIAGMILASSSRQEVQTIHCRLMAHPIQSKTSLESLLGRQFVNAIAENQTHNCNRIEAELNLVTRLPIRGTPTYLVYCADGRSAAFPSLAAAERFLDLPSSTLPESDGGCLGEAEGCRTAITSF